MTILPPPPPKPRHECLLPQKGHGDPPIPGALGECPECGRWWKIRVQTTPVLVTLWGWQPVRWYDIPARRRIAAHETEKMHYRVPTTVGDLHWWNCHPNPKRGRP